MSANFLKIIALIAMTVDHIGMILFPEQIWMRIVGRISYPVFAFMIAEGCRYTHSRLRYLLRIALIGIAMQIVLYAATGSLYQSVFISFTLAIVLICLIDKAKSEKRIRYWICVILYVGIIAFLCMGLTDILHETDYGIDYSIIGVFIPVLCYFIEEKRCRMLVFTLSLVILSASCGGIQWFCLLSVPLLGLYNYRRGDKRLKNLFYMYYPAHLCILFLIEKIIEH